MEKIKLIILSFAIVLFTACGSSDSDNNTLNLQDELRGQEIYAILDDIQVKRMLQISFDENLSSWGINIYDGNYSSPSINSFNNNISVTQDKLTDIGGLTYKLTDKNSNYTNLVSTTNSLIVLKLFSSLELAENYYNIDLRDELKAKEFFVVQNDLTSRSLLNIKINEENTQWDILTYDTNYDSQTGTSAGLSITVTDNNLTDSGDVAFWFNTKENDYLKLVSYGNSLVTLRFYESSELAQGYYDSADLRKELREKTFYGVSSLNEDKQLIKFAFDATLSQWEFNTYSDDYNQTAISSGTNSILVTEDTLIENNGDSLALSKKEINYIELKSISNTLLTYRLYSSSDLALAYYNQ